MRVMQVKLPFHSGRKELGWPRLKKLLNSPFFHYSAIVLIGVPLVAQLYLSAEEHFGKLPFAFPRILIIGFCGTALLFIAKEIFHHACPDEIKNFEDPVDYKDRYYATALQAHPDRRLEIVLANLDRTVENDIFLELTELKRTGNTPELEKRLERLYPARVQSYLINQYLLSSQTKPFVRWTCFLFWVSGAMLLLYIMWNRLDEVWKVAKK